MKNQNTSIIRNKDISEYTHARICHTTNKTFANKWGTCSQYRPPHLYHKQNIEYTLQVQKAAI